MTTYTADNMSRFLGNTCTDADAQSYGEYLEAQGWDLSDIDGEFHAFRGDEEMTESEWIESLDDWNISNK